jgi:hypothetical protein
MKIISNTDFGEEIDYINEYIKAEKSQEIPKLDVSVKHQVICPVRQHPLIQSINR